MSIKNKLMTGFGAIVAIILILLVLAYQNFNKVSEASGWDRHTLEVLLESNKIAANMLEVQAEMRGFLLTGDERFLSHNTDEEKVLADSVKRADPHGRQSGPAGPPAQARFAGRQLACQRRASADRTAPRARPDQRRGQHHGGRASAGSRFRTVREARALLAEIENDENRLLAARSTDSARLQQQMTLLLTGGGIACIVLALAIAYWLTRALTAPLNALTHAVGRIAIG
ncbi:CHASE3 domain-containing protein [Massilia sp. B-10]|nr:CHASE3 domain-containing protein [Massilia sp. B-10]